MNKNDVKCPENVLNSFYADVLMTLFASIRQHIHLRKKKNSRDYVLSILNEFEENLVLLLNNSVKKIYQEAYINAYNDINSNVSNNSINDD